jgi:hypothetical protein
MDYTAFSHGQLQSKLWLCDTLEPYIPHGSNIIILGSWYNLLGLLLLARNKDYNFVKGIDIDPNAITVANQLCQGYMIQPDLKIYNEVADANTYDYNGYQVFINCSIEHMSSDQWFHNIPNNFLVCLQSSNVNNNDPVWDIRNPTSNLDEFSKKYPLKHVLFRGLKTFNYDNLSYERYMVIGLK